MSKYQLVIFDCDGTLVDTETLINGATSKVLISMGYEKFTPEYCLEHFAGYGKLAVEEMLYNEIGKEFNFRDFEKHVNHLCLEVISDKSHRMTNAYHLLYSLPPSLKICIASNGDRVNVIESLKVTELLHFFNEEHIFTYEQVSRPKPAPDLFLYAAEQMGVEYNNCLVIEDSVAGATAGINAKMDVIGIMHKDRPSHQKIETLPLLAIIDDLIKVKDFL